MEMNINNADVLYDIALKANIKMIFDRLNEAANQGRTYIFVPIEVMSDDLKEVLESRGYEVVMYRTKDYETCKISFGRESLDKFLKK